MNIADLYIRVSTDEQAEKGYSQRNQEEVLRRYCELRHITVRHVYLEDHSAKTFKRPVWTKLLVALRKSKYKSDLILFTKWDRFSRNAGDAYNMINVLRRFGVEPQAIEQPLDLSVPENKLMLAFYLASPEVENDRRSLNVFNGQRKARKEGRWVNRAPIGYVNLSYENGRKYIAPIEPNASIMKWVFREIAKDVVTTQQIFNIAFERGLVCGKANLYQIVRNPIYCGKIIVPKHKDEESYLVDGLHEPLITEALFYKVQDILDGRKQNQRLVATKTRSTDMLPLRGFLICPKCGKMLSGSASKGRKNYYHYYHCFKGCSVRYKAEEVNDVFEKELSGLFPKENYIKFYRECIVKAFKLQHKDEDEGRKKLVEQIRELNAKITRTRELVLDGKFDEDDYMGVKRAAEKQIQRLESEIPQLVMSHKNIEADLNVCISNLFRARRIYGEGNTVKKREIIGACYTQNMVFADGLVRTAHLNDVCYATTLINRELEGQKKWTTSDLMKLSTLVGNEGFEPPTPSV
ncbi:MAG: recombinase family protein [Bacteroidota bacterium]